MPSSPKESADVTFSIESVFTFCVELLSSCRTWLTPLLGFRLLVDSVVVTDDLCPLSDDSFGVTDDSFPLSEEGRVLLVPVEGSC